MKYVIELVFCIGLLLKAFSFLPQAIRLYKIKKSDELSLLTFASLNIMQILTVLHAYIHQDYILMFGVLLSLLFCVSITFMIIIYRK